MRMMMMMMLLPDLLRCRFDAAAAVVENGETWVRPIETAVTTPERQRLRLRLWSEHS